MRSWTDCVVFLAGVAASVAAGVIGATGIW